MTTDKAREFWILWKSGYKNQATVRETKPLVYNDSLTHVIEHSAYQALKEENERLKEEIERIRSSHTLKQKEIY